MEKTITATTLEKQYTILAIGTEWFSRKGGLSTFNRLLCITLANLGHSIYCYIPSFSLEEEQNAKDYNVTLIKPKAIVGIDEHERLSRRPPLPESVVPDIIIGHGLVTGPYMQTQKEDYYLKSKTIFFIHTVPGEIEWHKPEKLVDSIAAKAEEKDNKQKELSASADLVAAVGPHLFYETQSLLAGLEKTIPLFQFNPGLSKPFNEIVFKISNSTPEALIVGRIEEFTLKGVDIGVLAMHKVYNEWNILTNGIDIKPRLILRGSPIGSDAELIIKLKEIENSRLRIQPKNYNADIDVINEDIRKSVVVMLPSRAEGFGLIALEAISNGRPVLISAESGLGLLLKQMMPNEIKDWIIPADIKDVDKWAARLYEIFKDRKTAEEKIKKVAEIYSRNITWEDSSRELLDFLNGKVKVEQKTAFVEKDNFLNVKYLGDGTLIHPDGQYEIRGRKSDFFASRLASAFPGDRGLVWYDNPKIIMSRLKTLLSIPLRFTIYPGYDPEYGGATIPIWWFRGGESMHIDDFEILSDTKCKIGTLELQLYKMAVYRSFDNYRSFIYLKVNGEKTVFDDKDVQDRIARQLDYSSYADEEYGIYRGKIISHQELDDGAAVIDGEVVFFEEPPELRTRFLTPFNILICSQSSVYNSNEANRILGNMLDELLKDENEIKLPDFIEQLEILDENNIRAIDFEVYD